MIRRALVIGASGDVGGGIVRALVADGWHVTAAARSLDRLRESAIGTDAAVATIRADLGSADGVAALLEAVDPSLMDAVVVSINQRTPPIALADLESEELEHRIRANLLPHVRAVRALVPRMREGTTYVAIGGGLADVTMRGLAADSIVQSSERVLIRAAAKEFGRDGVRVRLATIATPVEGHGARTIAAVPAMPADEVGALVVAIAIGDADDTPFVSVVPRAHGAR